MLTAEQQREADRIERERRRWADAMLFLLLAYVGRGRRAALDAARIGADPVTAFRDVVLGNPLIRQPGLMTALRGQVGRTYAAAARSTANTIYYRLATARQPLPARNRFFDLLAEIDADALAAAGTYDGWVLGQVNTLIRNLGQEVPQFLYAPGLRPQTAIRSALRAAGVGETIESPGALRAIADSLAAMAYDGGRGRATRLPVLNDKIWGLTWHTMRDERVRPNHRAMEGVTRPLDDPLWDVWVPPAGFNCRCSRLIRYRFENPRQTDAPGVLPDDGFAGMGNLRLGAA